MSRSSVRNRLVAGILVAAIGLVLLALITLTMTSVRRGASARAIHAEMEARWATDASARRPAHGGEAPRDARLAAGRFVVERGGEALGAEWKISGENGAPYFVTTGRLPDPLAAPWISIVAGARDERLPEPSEEVRAWMDAHGPALRALAHEISAGPTPEWEPDYRWDTTREARLADVLARHLEMLAAVHAQRGEHPESEALLDAAWTLRAGIARLRPADLGDFVMLGALRCTRVSDAAEWLRRLDSVDVRAEEAGDLLHRAGQRLRRAEASLADGPAWLPPAAHRLLRAPAELEAAMDSEEASESASRLLALDPCTEPAAAIPATWRRDHQIAQWRPQPGRAQVAWDMAIAAEREVPLRLTRAVLRTRAGLPPDDPCGLVSSSSAPDGRTTLRWGTEPHPLAVELGVVSPREFTLDAGP